MFQVDVQKTYRGRKVLSIEGLSFEKGKRYALIGANGSGKSTLIKVLAGAVKPDSGKAILTKDINLAYMPQKCLGFSMSVKKNIMSACPLSMLIDKKSRHKAVESSARLMEQMRLTALAKNSGARLSGGEMQRVALCRILLLEHDILLLDEPTSAMDIESIKNAESALNEYYAMYKPTIIFATHSFGQAERLADEVLLLDNGLVMERGSPNEVYNSPTYTESKKIIEFLK